MGGGGTLLLSRLGAVMMQVSSSSGWQWSAFKVWFDSHPASLSLSLSVSLSRYLSLSSALLASLPLSSSPLSLSSQPAALYLSKLLFSLLPCLPLSPCLFSVPRPLSVPVLPLAFSVLSVPVVLPLNILFQVQTLARTRSCSLPHSRRSLRSAPSLTESLFPCPPCLNHGAPERQSLQLRCTLRRDPA